ncbi:hypothetical protein N7470_004067 [Penicillium chermesinum]|nr:hypothetical protein N7470_004067 [Penicillium chermesinum]
MSTHTENAVTPEQTQQEKKGTKIKLVNPLHQFIYRGIAGGIGLASEAIQHRKAKKATANENSGLPAANEAETRDQLVAENELEANWQLDEAQDAICCPEGPPSYQETTQSDAADSSQQNTTEHATQEHPSKLADRFPRGGPGSDAAAGTASGYTRGRIELPVLLTQRRPGKRSRGFIRAYAPILQNAGITQDAFMDFVDDLNSAVEPNGLIQALNLASLAGIAIASPAAIALSIGIQLATNIGDEVHSRTKTNSFIDKVNRDFFAPRGLVAAVLTWKPSDTNEFVMSSFDGESAVTSAMDSRQQDTGSKKFKHRFHASAGIAPCEWPETAPLVFPDLDKLVGRMARSPM